MMSEFFSNGRVIDAILVLMIVEGLLLAAYHHRTGRGLASIDIVLNLAAGAFLLLALRGALVGAGWQAIAASLAAALVAHLMDLRRRLSLSSL